MTGPSSTHLRQAGPGGLEQLSVKVQGTSWGHPQGLWQSGQGTHTADSWVLLQDGRCFVVPPPCRQLTPKQSNNQPAKHPQPYHVDWIDARECMEGQGEAGGKAAGWASSTHRAADYDAAHVEGHVFVRKDQLAGVKGSGQEGWASAGAGTGRGMMTPQASWRDCKAAALMRCIDACVNQRLQTQLLNG